MSSFSTSWNGWSDIGLVHGLYWRLASCSSTAPASVSIDQAADMSLGLSVCLSVCISLGPSACVFVHDSAELEQNSEHCPPWTLVTAPQSQHRRYLPASPILYRVHNIAKSVLNSPTLTPGH